MTITQKINKVFEYLGFEDNTQVELNVFTAGYGHQHGSSIIANGSEVKAKLVDMLNNGRYSLDNGDYSTNELYITNIESGNEYIVQLKEYESELENLEFIIS